MIKKVTTPDHPGLQLWSLLPHLKQNLERTIDWVYEKGFIAIELAGFATHKPKEIAKVLKKKTMQVLGVHSPPLDQHTNIADLGDWCVKHASIFDTKTIIIASDPSYYGDDNPFTRAHKITKLKDQLNHITEILCSHNLRLAYHAYKHDYISSTISPYPVYLQLLSHIDTQSFGLQIDTYFLHAACKKSSAITTSNTNWNSLVGLLRYPDVSGRVHSFHLTDSTAHGAACRFGRGEIEWKKFFQIANESFPESEWILEPCSPEESAKHHRAEGIIEQARTDWLSLVASL